MLESATRYIQGRVIISGERVEFWQYENPVRADIIERHRLPADLSSDLPKREDNLFRAQQRVRQLIWANLTPYTKVLTLTFAETELDLQSMRRKIQTFLQRMKRHGYDLNYIWVPEHQKKRGAKEGNAGSLHAHFVLFNDEKIPIELLKGAWPYGKFDIQIAAGCKQTDKQRINSLAAYLSKYITKDTFAEYGSRSFNPSLHLAQPETIDIECFKIYDERSGNYYFTDSEQNLNYYLKKFDFDFQSTYLRKFKIKDDIIESGVLYRQGSVKK